MAKQSKVKNPAGRGYINVNHISTLNWGDLEDLEELQEELTDEANSRPVKTINKFLKLLAPDLTKEDRRKLSKEQVNTLIEDIWAEAQKTLDEKEAAAEEEERAGKT